jgi:hypothetical protein
LSFDTRKARSRCAPPLISTPSRAGPVDRSNDRHEGRQLQRAGAGHEQNHQGPVDPSPPDDRSSIAHVVLSVCRRSKPGVQPGGPTWPVGAVGVVLREDGGRARRGCPRSRFGATNPRRDPIGTGSCPGMTCGAGSRPGWPASARLT